MGKGDKRSKKGKRISGSYGNARPNPNKLKRKEQAKRAAKKEKTETTEAAETE